MDQTNFLPTVLQNPFPLDMIIGAEATMWQDLIPIFARLGLFIETRPTDRTPKLCSNRVQGYSTDSVNQQITSLLTNPTNIIYGMPTRLFQLCVHHDLNIILVRIGNTGNISSPSVPIAILKNIRDVNDSPYVLFVAPLGGNVFKCILRDSDKIITPEFANALKKLI